ncbi:Ubiquitin- ligase sel1 protein [Rutstroemia sp. NJR-2017a WRK4]|nr:Ubiquitin- ligase sel1 protein [Rutstroemia sp. NJR-2017a WRK4]
MSVIYGRDTFIDQDGEVVTDGNDPFWYTRTGRIIRWSVFFGLFGLFLIWVIGGYWHAKRRISKGLTPLAYHRWLLSRRQRAMYDPAYQDPPVYYTTYPPPGQYGMHPMPPPMYDPNAQMPPTYQPPAGATKLDPSQFRAQTVNAEPSPEYEAPPGPPPAAVQANHTGASNNPYRG